MRALVARRYAPAGGVGGPAVGEVARPEPGPGEALLRVEAAAVNAFDARLAAGELRHLVAVEFPLVLGTEAAGVVEAVGDGVTRVEVGDPVVAFTYGSAGAVAEYTLAADGPGLVARPPGLDAVRAAALPVAGLTAVRLLGGEVAGPVAGRDVLVVGATGGVGLVVVQLAARAGARVLATAGPADAAYVRSLGAAATVDHTAPGGIAPAVRGRHPSGVDVVVDLVNAGPALAATAALARRGGRLVSTHRGVPSPEGFDRGVSAAYVHVTPAAGVLAGLADRAAAGELVVTVDRTYPFAEAPRALADLVSTHTRGKLVVTF